MSFTFQAADYPATPGCYIMKGNDGRILYIGKSKSLRNRLRSYFTEHHSEQRLQQLVQEIAAIDVLLVNNEAESLLLENNLIKIHKPPYNRALKRDNSGYAYLQLTADRFPRLVASYRNRELPLGSMQADMPQLPQVKRSPAPAAKSKRWRSIDAVAQTLKAASDQPRRLGPFPSARFRDALIEFVAAHFGLRTCESMPKRACLLYHIGRCSGVCEGKISEEEYRERAHQAAELLGNDGHGLIAALYARMERYASLLEFEKAQTLLTHIRILERAEAKQIVDRDSHINQDVLYLDKGYVLVASVREGMLADMEWHKLDDSSVTENLAAATPESGEPAGNRAFDRFLVKRYTINERPDELIVNRIGDAARVRAALRRRGQPPLTITLPKRGLKFELLQLCKQNHEYRLSRTSFI
jgi:excinuclease ABC subunit C